MANVPKKISVGNRTVVGDQVLNAQDRTVEREQLNRIIKNIRDAIASLRQQLADLIAGGGGESGDSTYELAADPTNFSLDNVEGDSWYLDIIPGGIDTTDLADGAVTGPKIDFTTFDSDDIVEGTTNLYFTDERAQDAVGTILIDGTFVDLDYADGVPSITADLSATGTPSTERVLRGDNAWADGVTSTWVGGSFVIGNIGYFSTDLNTRFNGEGNVQNAGVIYGGTQLIFTDPSGGWDVLGLIGGSSGRLYTFAVDPSSAANITLANDGATNPEDNIKTPDGNTYEIAPGSSVTLRYVADNLLANPGYWVFEAVTAAGGGGGGGVETVVAGDGIDVDSTDPENPVVALSPQEGGITVTAGAPGGPLLPVGTTITAIAPNGYDLTDWLMVCDPSGDLEVDIRVVDFASYPPTSGDSITGTGRPEITADTSASGDTSLWASTSIATDDVVAAVVTGASGVRWFSLTLRGTRTVTP